ncbi:MAG: DUF1194 domain-containing protein [Pseudomonadota bacterium]
MKLLPALLAGLVPGPALACGLELVLAMDVSRSIIITEYALQMGGMARAFRDPAVVAAIEGTEGGIMVTLTQWSGPASQDQSIPWTRLTTEADAHAFAHEITQQERPFFAPYTAVGEALYHAAEVSAANPVACRRRVIDVSGDGTSNRGRPARAAADMLEAEGYTINGLAIVDGKKDLAGFYRRNVARGPASFVEIADGFEDYARAIRTKLLREMSPQLAAAR